MVNNKEVLDLLPLEIKDIVGKVNNIQLLQEIRIKINKPLILFVGEKEIVNSYLVSREDMSIIMKRISNYSIYSIEDEIKQGYVTLKGGHRVGICGNCVLEGNKIRTIKNVSSINIRICREVIGCSSKVIPYIISKGQILNTIIISPPKCGKTTLVRDIVRTISDGLDGTKSSGKKVCVIDERSEICSSYEGVPQLNVGIRTDVMDACPKSEGIMMAIRSMAPDVIACDEIGSIEDIKSIMIALSCGINMITTIHGFGIEDIYNRKLYENIVINNVFQRAVVLSVKRGVGTVEYIYDFISKEKMRGIK